jgi:RimJ/RimL family protein N-acetyltransferase
LKAKPTSGMTPRADVALLPLEITHAARTYRWICDPLVRDNLGVRAEPSLVRTREWIEKVQGSEVTRAFAVTLAGAHVGNAVIDRIDRYLQTGRLSVYIGQRDARGSGVGRSACYRLLEDAFGPAGLGKVWLTAHARNHAALSTYVRLGFRIEGILREEFLLAGERIDAFLMSILRREFPAPGQPR